MKEIIDFLFETGVLAKTPRSGFWLLGSGKQSVAEHLFRTAMIGYSLCKQCTGINEEKVIRMCLFHDLAEARISDLNYMSQKYVEKNEEEAINDLTENLPFGDDIKELLREYHERTTRESIIAKDSDTIEWILSLKEQEDQGNKEAPQWIEYAYKRLKTKQAQELAKEIKLRSSHAWYREGESEQWWINRIKKEKTPSNHDNS